MTTINILEYQYSVTPDGPWSDSETRDVASHPDNQPRDWGELWRNHNGNWGRSRVVAYAPVAEQPARASRSPYPGEIDAHFAAEHAAARADSAELGCEIAYKREPTQAEGDAHEWRRPPAAPDDDSELHMGQCHVAMGDWLGRRCSGCRRWVWDGSTRCAPCWWREDIEQALGVEPDTAEHTPSWAHERVLAIREIGNRSDDERDRLRAELAEIALAAITRPGQEWKGRASVACDAVASILAERDMLDSKLATAESRRDGLQIALFDADKHTKLLAIRVSECRALLQRMVKYVLEDKAVTPGMTRLARCVDEVADYLRRTREPGSILRGDT
jgi:hypothetical protein